MSNTTITVARRVHTLNGEHDDATENPADPLESLRESDAWVLLGEPGAGKSSSMRAEANETGGLLLRVAEFVAGDPSPDWRGKTLFLDGLDEVRASGREHATLSRVCGQLKLLGCPQFRLACRAADWHGATDHADLEHVSPNGKVVVLSLEELTDQDVLKLLQANHRVAAPEQFVAYATQRGIGELLKNPEMLRLLVAAVHGAQDASWPATRDETYELACKHLVSEANKRHRDVARNAPTGEASAVDDVLDAAGQICAVLLLADKDGFALDADQASNAFPLYTDIARAGSVDVQRAIHSKLFVPEQEERLAPSHRGISEYLAARWLANQIDGNGLPLARVLNLLVGQDGQAVAGLRGLYAWLALRCHTARPRLIAADPMTVLIYGDVAPMSTADKRQILMALRHESERTAGVAIHTRDARPLGALVCVDLVPDFLAVLDAPARDHAKQTYTACILDALSHGAPQKKLQRALISVVRDDTRWPGVRRTALRVWLNVNTDPSFAIALLNEITGGDVTDPNDELSGTLLRALYPSALASTALLKHLHRPKDVLFYGAYERFWTTELARNAPISDLPVLLDLLVAHDYKRSSLRHEHRIDEMSDVLLAKGITHHGDSIADERLFNWLGVGGDEEGEVRRGNDARDAIVDWLDRRPARYKALLALCYRHCMRHEHPRYCVYMQSQRLLNADVPNDIGVWHLQHALPEVDEFLAQVHLQEAAYALMNGRGCGGLSFEMLLAWRDAHPHQQQWLDQLLYVEIPEWRIEHETAKAERQQNAVESKRDTTKWITPQLDAIRAGSADAFVMNQLAGVWANRFANTPGDTPLQRFNNYCDNGADVLEAAEIGLRLCPCRPDLPSIHEINKLSIKSSAHYVRLACLVGMQMRWNDGEEQVDQLPEETLRINAAFYLTDSHAGGLEWFKHLVATRPEVVADVFVAYASAKQKAGHANVDFMHQIAHDADYRVIAAIASPKLLDAFPTRARTSQLLHLEHLLRAAIRWSPNDLRVLMRKKLRVKNMDVGQQTYWHVAAALIDDKTYEAGLWRFVGLSRRRVHHVARFLGEFAGGFDLSASATSKLVVMLAPDAMLDRPHGGGLVTDAMRRGDLVRSLIARLGAMDAPDADNALAELCKREDLAPLKQLLAYTRHERQQRQRENAFRYPALQSVVQVLANSAPTNVADLAALVLDHLDDIAIKLQHDNDDGYRSFWNVQDRIKTGKRDENDCRDVLLTRLRARLDTFNVDCQPEGDYVGDKRADIRVSYMARYELPIEIKRDSNDKMWTGLRQQLIGQYGIAPLAAGYGIYVVLWFDGQGIARTIDGGKKPRSPAELQARLEAVLTPSEQRRISVRVIDVGWRHSPAKK